MAKTHYTPISEWGDFMPWSIKCPVSCGGQLPTRVGTVGVSVELCSCAAPVINFFQFLTGIHSHILDAES